MTAAITTETMHRWLFDHYQEHIQDGAINVTSLEAALASEFGGRPNRFLNEFVTEFCLDLQDAMRKAQP